MRFTGVLILIMMLYSCSDQVVYVQEYNVDEKGWDYKRHLDFEFDIEDEKQDFNLLLNLTYLKTYAYQNVFFFVDVTGPKDQFYRDTIECIMATPSGKWLGNISGDYVEHQYMYRYRTTFPQKGSYQIKIQHGMRDTMLAKMSVVGIELEKFSGNK